MLQPTQTVANVVLEHSECAPIFQRHRIDFCCRGGMPLAEAAKERGLEAADLIRELEAAIAERRGDAPPSPKALSTPALLAHIVDKHHAYLRKTLPFVRPLAAKVARVHGGHNPKLVALDQAVGELSAALVAHLDDEETKLFPALAAGEPGAAAGPLRAMMDEHLEVAKLLEQIRGASDDFTLPDWACGSYRALFGELEALERDIFQHVHLENHVLAPRFDRATVVPGPAARVDLAAELEALRRGLPEAGHAAKTLVRTDDQRVVLVALRTGARIAEHKTEHAVVLQGLAGAVELRLPTGAVELGERTIVPLPRGVPHEVEAKGDAALLLTIQWAGAAG